jgi:phosphocarrier protein HPr
MHETGAVIRTLEIVNIRGLHARASRKMAELALTFQSRILVRKDDDEADATSLMDLMMLGAGIGSFIELRAEGADAQAAIDALAVLVADKFGEGE